VAGLVTTQGHRILEVEDGDSHDHVIGDVAGLQAALDSAGGGAHEHEISEVSGLQTALDGKQASGSYAAENHNHDSTYAAAGHDHDSDYAALDHTHPGGGSALDAWPVGSVYIAVDATSPATKFGGGTWAAFGAGRMLIGINSSDTDFDTAEETGGAKTSSAVVNHTHGVTITDPGHDHVENSNNATTGGLRGWGAADTSTNTSTATGYSTASSTTGISASTANPAGGVASFSLMNPYIVCYFWKRTA
jgi:microcystin-dependent protein